MIYINTIALFTALGFYAVYQRIIEPGFIGQYGEKQLLANKTRIRLVILGCLFFKLLTSALYKGFDTDMGCFYGWSNLVVEGGFNNFYTGPTFTDYPPGYIYILYILGWIVRLFKISYDSVLMPILFKSPAVICDVLTGYIIYKVARKRFKESTALIFFFLYALNPAIYINSSIWGQVDSVYAFFVISMLYLLVEEKFAYAIMSFAIGVLIKPQTVFFLPILAFVCFRVCFLEKKEERYHFKFNSSKFVTILLWAIIGIGSIFLLMCPFGIGNVINQYLDTVGSYNYATINAYNFWELIGKNWKPQDDMLFKIPYYVYGYGSIIITVILSAVFYFKSKLKEDTKIYLTAAFVMISIFLFSVRMHERYMYPALALLLLTYLTKPYKNMFIVYILFSVAHFYNVSHVLFLVDHTHFDWVAVIPKSIAFFTLLVFGLFIYVMRYYYKNRNDDDLEQLEKKKESNNDEVTAKQTVNVGKDSKMDNKAVFKSAEKVKFTKKDWLIMLGITLVYALIAFYNLGYNYAPETYYTVENRLDTMEFNFPEGTVLSKCSIYDGTYESRQFRIESFSSTTNRESRIASNISSYKYPVIPSVFNWNSIDLTKSCDADEQDAYNPDAANQQQIETQTITGDTTKLKFTFMNDYDKAELLEMVFLDENGKQVLPTNKDNYPELFDEQEKYDPTESYRSGTYFDEVYHARTAYEFLRGLPTYEWTHPPFGKILISLGVSIFGMNPFGWRFMGTLFGVLMLPIIFLFARKIFKKTWVAGMACLLFAVDFMHFAQTRIATIDVFVTFFIILMYYFMYQYTQVSFYDKKMYKCLLPLGLCGISTGLAVASKVTGAYAAVGLAVIFFVDLRRRYKEYRYACMNPKMTTNGVAHADVIKSFKRNTIYTILFCVLVFLVIPFIIYTLSYIPFINKYRTEELSLLQRMWINQGDMFNYHSGLDATHTFSSTWYEWPICLRPIYYFARDISTTTAEGISSFGNPIIWWTGIIAFFGTIYYSAFYKDRKGAFILVGFLAQYLPWVLVSRCTFIYHYFPSVPFVILMVTYCIYSLVEHNPKKVHKLKPWIIAFLVLCVVTFIMFYPVLSGMTVSKWYVNHFLKWIPEWTLLAR